MGMFSKQGSPFLYDENTKDIVGISDPDGSYTPILTPVEVMGVRAKGVDFIGFPDGTTDNKAALRAAIATVSELGGGVVNIPAGFYWITLAGDADTIRIPSNVTLNCLPGSLFLYDYSGSPLFAMVEVSSASILGYTIVYSGAFTTEVTTVSAFDNWVATIPRYRLCTDIAVLGSHKCQVKGRHISSATDKVQNQAILIDGPDDGTSYSYGHTIDIMVDDRCQGIVAKAWASFDAKVLMGRNPQNSFSLYGSGHAVYDIIESTSKDGKYTIIDTGEYVDTLSMTASHTLSLKNASNVIASVISERCAGPLNFAKLTDCTIDVRHRYDGSISNASVGAIYYTGQGGVSSGVTIRGSIWTSSTNYLCYATATGSSTNALSGTKIDLQCIRAVDAGATAVASAYIGEINSDIKITSRQTGGASKIVCNFGTTAANNAVEIVAQEGGARVSYSTGAGNIVKTSGAIAYAETVSSPTGGNSLSRSMSRNKAAIAVASSTSPSTTLQLPTGGGAFLLWVNLTTQDYNHARAGLYMVMYDDSTNDFTTTALIGSQITKGTSPTSLTVTIDATGLVTLSGAIAAASATYFEVGYSELHKRI